MAKKNAIFQEKEEQFKNQLDLLNKKIQQADEHVQYLEKQEKKLKNDNNTIQEKYYTNQEEEKQLT